ncbi:MAG: beta-carotene hydroxylase [Cyanobacteria bacterium]|nr:beta-carotene hydroxylase [Cyanobacteria bacterium CG_2015-16_32_12]NCO76876.1 beta-carotene hydroxylase [Cyanobacteria bacterium CG_2015-22_32_23]NCQ03329.1 beta-carotene hydroxylase [Cyanobacteria bacterium CG_2015-09_32_10]NCQ43124.1 beta-carotene hydroxylase [Cyanobacteria bacterium CG_2015-04_32_10]NCS84368.1 beta-carotene hydroxylase [Cyanobacteria bacterium CG_2015-02_32_10]
MQSVSPVLKSVPREYLKAHGGFNPNVLMFITAISLITISTCGYFLWGWTSWICFTANVLALHMSGTVIHDASHNSGHKNPIINSILGHGSALMLGFAFPVFTRVHLQHHAHVNDPENDPDHFVSTGGPLWLIAARFFYHEIFFFKRKLWRNNELLEWFLSRLFLFTVVFLGIYYDFIGYVMNFWFVPALVVGIALGLFFDYLPHRPFKDRDRWKNARVYPSKILNFLILGQNYHLIHHLWPSIPWYQYQPAYYATKPLLDAKECDQSLDLLKGKNFWSFMYDLFLGIRFHH